MGSLPLAGGSGFPDARGTPFEHGLQCGAIIERLLRGESLDEDVFIFNGSHYYLSLLAKRLNLRYVTIAPPGDHGRMIVRFSRPERQEGRQRE